MGTSATPVFAKTDVSRCPTVVYRSGAGGARKPLIVSDLQLQRRKPFIINNLQHLKYYYLFGLFSLFALFGINLLTLHIFIFIYLNRGSLFI